MDFGEHEDQEEEMEMSAEVPPGGGGGGGGGGEGATSGAAKNTRGTGVRYRECLKNHAVSIGGHAVDGCGEFMPAGDDGTLESLKCAACGCHRNFHRKETDSTPHHHQLYHQLTAAPTPPPPPYYGAPPPPYLPLGPPRPLALLGPYAREDQEADDVSNPSSSGGGGGKKRLRTKFTPEQKEKMLAFAERLGWRIQKHDDAAVEQFCNETGIRRQVLKVWMHNNKHTLGKKP